MEPAMRLEAINPRLVELAPKPLEQGVLYISQKYQVAVHLCCCGCGEKVVTPLSHAEWQLHMHNGMATLHPSVGNRTPCRSHYWLTQNRVEWVSKMTAQQIRVAQKRDRASLDAMYASRAPTDRRLGWLARAEAAMKSAWDWFQGRR